MAPAERIFNVLFGLSALSWAVLGLVNESPEARFTVPRLAAAAINLCVSILFLVRGPVVRHGPPALVLLAVPSLVLGGAAFKLAPEPDRWPLHASILFASGLGWTCLSLLFLGRSFAILPARRGIVTRGPYGLVRHPAYLGEIVALLGCGMAAGTLQDAWPAAAAIPLVALRILAEERVLRDDPAYDGYCARVRGRLIPGVW